MAGRNWGNAGAMVAERAGRPRIWARSKGQTSVELLLVVGLVMMLLLTITLLLIQKNFFNTNYLTKQTRLLKLVFRIRLLKNSMKLYIW